MKYRPVDGRNDMPPPTTAVRREHMAQNDASPQTTAHARRTMVAGECRATGVGQTDRQTDRQMKRMQQWLTPLPHVEA